MILKKSKQLGFTLLELILVISVITILSTVGIAAFVEHDRSVTVQTAASGISSVLNQAKSRAISQTKPEEFCADQSLEGYLVEFDVSENTYALKVQCGYPYTISEYYLPEQVEFNEQTTTSRVFFPILTFGVTGAGDISITGYEKTRTVTVDSQGNIK